MLIASKFHDYYDVAMKYGVDKTVVYERSGDTVKMKQYDELIPSTEETGSVRIGRQIYNFTFYKLIVGFCGKLYPLMHVKRSPSAGHVGTDTYFNFYDREEFLEFLKENRIDHEDTKRYRIWHRRNLYIDNVSDVKEFFDPAYWKDLLPIFSKLNVPVFIIGKDYTKTPVNGRHWPIVTPNPQLKQYKFMKVKDPITAFQDIFMYISGVLGVPTRPMVKLSDKELAKKRGHGDKYSFRKTPTKKRK